MCTVNASRRSSRRSVAERVSENIGVRRAASSLVFACLIHVLLVDACLAQGVFTRPGPEHEALRKMEGTWDVALTLPGGIKAKGTMTSKMECGGLWLVRDLRANLGGLKLQTKEWEGYDPLTKRHLCIQIDSMTTIPMRLEGTYDEATKSLIQTGEARDFNGQTEQVKSISKANDDDHYIVAVYRVYPDGKEKKHLTLEYTRRKAPKETAP